MWLKWTKRILAALGILIVLIIAFVMSVIYIYEDEVKQYAIEQLNKNLKVAVKAPEIDLTLMDQFPNASLRFNDVLIPDYLSENGTDTMFYAKHIYLEFDFWDMMSGNYKVQKVSMENATANLFINSSGEKNFDIYKTDTTETEASKFSFALKELTGTDININYVDSSSYEWYKTYSKDITFTGDFNEEAFDMKVLTDLTIKNIHTNNVTYIDNKDAHLDLNLNINNDSSKYTINKADLEIEELLFNITGYFQSKTDSSNIDLNIKGKNIDLASAFSIFPKQYIAPLEKYKAKGLVVFESSIVGMVTAAESPHITAEFYLNDGSLEEQTSNVSLKKLSLNGNFDSDKNGVSYLAINDISGAIDVGSINGNVVIENLSEPKITVKTNGSINLNQLKEFVNSSSIDQLSGQTIFDAYFVAQSSPTGIELIKSKGDFDFKNAAFKLPTSGIVYSKLNGKLILNKNDAAITNFHGFAEDSDFRLDGAIKNLVPYILSSEEVLTIEADLRTQKLNLDLLMQNATSQADAIPVAFVPETVEPFELPNNIHLNLKSQIDQLTYGKFNTTEITGIITLANQKLQAKNFKFKANKGKYVCTTDIEQNPDKTFTWNTKMNADGVDIQNFFYEMDNFGQDFITDKNIVGRGDVDIDMAVLLNNDLTLDENSLIADIKLFITKGELIEQSSMIEIADYFNENKAVKLVLDTKKLRKKMEHIKFSELSNTITIKDGQILIPKMTIKSNIMDLNIAGTHSFIDEIDYHFSFTLRKLYYKNVKQEEFGPLQDDGLGKKLYLRMYGTLDDPHYELDSKEKHIELKENIEKEKKDVKSILKSELGLFKKDTSVHEYVAPKKIEPTFEIEWEEFDENEKKEEGSNINNDVDSQPIIEEEEKKKKDKGINKLLKKLGVEEEKKKELQIQIDD